MGLMSSSPSTSYLAKYQWPLEASLLKIWMCTEHSEATLQIGVKEAYLHSQFATELVGQK